MNDVLIIGGGPAGATAAIGLVERGHKVTLLDRSSDLSAKLPETLYPSARGLLQQLNVDAPVTKPVSLRLLSRSGDAVLSMSLDGRTRDCVTIDRNALDRALRAEAIRLGADVVTKCAIANIERCGSWFTARTANNIGFSARLVIDASGKDAIAASLVGGLAIEEQPLDPRSNAFSHYESEAGFDLDALSLIESENGFLYAIPIRAGRISLGWVSYAPVAAPLMEAAYLAAIATTPVARDLIGNARRIMPVITAKNAQSRALRPSGDGVFLAGDALGFRDPFFWDGIGFALASGRLAASACSELLEGHAGPEAIESFYAQELRTAEAAARTSAGAVVESVSNLFTPLQMLDPHMPVSLLSAFVGLSRVRAESVATTLRERRTHLHLLEQVS